MSAVVLISILLCGAATSSIIPDIEPIYSQGLVTCVKDIITKYFASKELTYIGNKHNDNEVLKAVHDSNAAAIISQLSPRKIPKLHESYLILSNNLNTFTKQIQLLNKEKTWNPNAHFLIILSLIIDFELDNIFNELLKEHINNVIVINGTANTHLYSYNSYENYGCGKYYTSIISYGSCSKAGKENLFPYKYISGLKNCTLNVAIPNSPPYTVFPTNNTNHSSLLAYGVEPYLLRLVGEMENFKLNIILQNGTETITTASNVVDTDGPWKMLQNDEADVIMGGLLLIPSRAVAFEYAYDFFPYVDELRFVVRRTEFVAAWKTFYLEFDGLVWVLILLSLAIYSILMVILLRVEDKSAIVFKLLDNLVLHSCNINSHSTVKWIFIIWVWFATLINSFYQSSLVSLTTNPAMECQVSDEEDLGHHKLRPCFDEVMEKYYLESTQSSHALPPAQECHGLSGDILQKLVETRGYYSLALHGLFEYNIQKYNDENGDPGLFIFKTPYSKVLYCMYFYKGFPLIRDIRVSALRLREMGVVEKAMADMNYLQSIKHRFHGNTRKFFLVIPWQIYIFGCTISLITFVVEVLSKRNY